MFFIGSMVVCVNKTLYAMVNFRLNVSQKCISLSIGFLINIECKHFFRINENSRVIGGRRHCLLFCE